MSHVYEMRSYYAAAGKMDALLARFADHTEAIFERHGLKTIGYWIPHENPKNLLMYILEHESLEAAEKNWDAFRADREWQTIKAETDAAGPLVVEIERCFMDRVDFSRHKSRVSSKT